MKAVIWIVLLLAPYAWPDEITDRAAIERTIRALNDAWTNGRSSSVSAFLTEEARREFDLLRGLSRGAWSERTPPHFEIRSIRFVTAEVALIDGEITQFGSLTVVRRVPALLVVTGKGDNWRITAIRTLDQKN